MDEGLESDDETAYFAVKTENLGFLVFRIFEDFMHPSLFSYIKENKEQAIKDILVSVKPILEKIHTGYKFHPDNIQEITAIALNYVLEKTLMMMVDNGELEMILTEKGEIGFISKKLKPKEENPDEENPEDG